MSILVWIIFGGLVGWVASKIMGTDEDQGILANVIVGVVGAFVGGLMMQFFDKTGVIGFNIRSFLVSLLGAVVLIGLFKAIFR